MINPGRAANWQIIEAIMGDGPPGTYMQVIELPAGAFVRPIELHYLPKGTLERLGERPEWFDPERWVICYTAKGMRKIARSNLRATW